MSAVIVDHRNFWQKYRDEYAALVRMGFPVLLTQLGVIVMSFADTLMVGAYGVEELAASAFVNSTFLIPLVMLSGLAAGITPLVGALFSVGRHLDTGRIAKAGLQINTIVALVFTTIMGAIYFFLDSFGQPEELMPIIRPYYLMLLGTLLPMALFNSLSQTSNGMTDTRTPMWCILGAIATNIIGNWLLIFGNLGCPRLGLTGAGIATVLSRWAGVVAIFIIYRRANRYADCREGLFKSSHLGAERRKVWLTSYPVMIQNGVECSLWSFGAVACGWFGKIQLAAYQIVNTIGQLGFMIYMSVGIAVSIRVANFSGLMDEKGAGHAARAGLHLNLLLATVASLVMWLAAHPLIGEFTTDNEVIAAAMLFVFPLVLYQYLDAVQLTFINAIRGTSQVKPLLWISLISYIAVGIPILLLFSVTLDLEGIGVYYSFDVALAAAAILAAIAFKRTKIGTQTA